ncbi:MAG: FtsX-like permease family protein [Candidatus Heimdallarchaeota archaeon]
MSKFTEQLKIYMNLLQLNRRSTILSFLGLGLSLILISEGLIFTYSFQYGAFEEYTSVAPPKQVSALTDMLNFPELPSDMINTLQNISQQAIDEQKINSRIKKVDWHFEKGQAIGAMGNNGIYQFIKDVNRYGVSFDYFSTLEKLLFNGTLPSNSTDIMIVVSSNTISNMNLSNTGDFPLYRPIFGGWVYEGPVTVSGIIARETLEDHNGSFRDDFQSMLGYFTENFMLMNNDNFPTSEVRAIGRFSFHLNEIDSFKIQEEISMVNAFSQELSIQLKKEEINVFLYNELGELLQGFAEEYRLFQLFGLMFLAPLTAVTIALSSFSANQLKRRQKHHIALMYQRGATRGSTWILLIFQLLEVTFSGIVMSISVGYPFSWLILKSNGFLSFSQLTITPAVNISIFSGIIISAFVISFFTNLGEINKLTKISLVEASTGTDEKKQLWQKLFLDFVLIALGVAIWFIINYPLKEIKYYTLAYIIGIVSPAMIILGGVLLTARIYLWLTRRLSSVIGKRDGLGIIWFSMKRGVRRQGNTIRGIILLVLTISLTFTAIISVHSYQKYNEEQAYYSLGSDILVRNVLTFSDETKNQLLAVEGIESVTYIQYTSQLVTYGDSTYSYIVVGINQSEYAKTAYFDKEYLDGKSPEEFFSAIKNSTNIVIQKDQLEKVASLTSEKIVLPADHYPDGIIQINLQIVGIYNYLPRFFTEFPDVGSTVYRFTIVGNYDLVNQTSYSSVNIAYDIFIKTAKGYSPSTIASEIEEMVSGTIRNVEDEHQSLSNDFKNTMLFGSVNTTFLISVIIITASTFLLIVSQLVEYENEINTLRILGFSPKQFFTLFLSEIIPIMFFGILTSTALGSLASKIIMDVLTFKIDIPSFELVFPAGQTIITILSLLGIALITTVITIRVIFRKEKPIARQEEATLT